MKIGILSICFALALSAAPALGGQGVDAQPPVVIKTVPVAGDKAVDPGLKEIRVTFSKDMITKKSWSFVQVSKDSFPKTTGEPRFVDARTCVLPVALKPGGQYVVWINKGKFSAFRDTNKRSAVPYLLSFEVKK